MSLARVSNLPTIDLSGLSQNQRYRSFFEFSMLSDGTLSDGMEYEKWLSRSIAYEDLANTVIGDSKTSSNVASESEFGYIKLGAACDPANYIFPLSVDADGRAFTQIQNQLQGYAEEQWEFTLSTGAGQTERISKTVLVK